MVYGLIWGLTILGIARQPSLYNKLFTLGILSFALVESMALFSLLITFLILYS